MYDSNVKIGETIGHDKAGDIVVTRLHELCNRTVGPHLHVVTNRDETCHPFPQPRS